MYLGWLNPIPYNSSFWSALLDDSQREAIQVVVTTCAAFGLILTVWDLIEDRRLTQERLVTDRFSKAAGLLANQDNSVRVAAIYSLERIAKDSPKDHWTIMELLSALSLKDRHWMRRIK